MPSKGSTFLAGGRAHFLTIYFRVLVVIVVVAAAAAAAVVVVEAEVYA